MTGPAIIHMRDGTFVASFAELSHGVVTFTGALRVRDLAGARTYQGKTRSHRLRSGEWVEWTGQEHAVSQ
jgi:hypothetical protein